MQGNDWAPEHCRALQDYLALGMSFAEIAREINARFGTTYSRNAAIGRSKRMKLTAPKRPPKPPAPPKSRPRIRAGAAPKFGENRPGEASRPAPASAAPPPEPTKLRCVGISPRLVSLMDLQDSECRYPYGGDRANEPITFCGHPRLPGSPYCAPHFHLTRGDGTEAERAVAPVVLRLVKAA